MKKAKASLTTTSTATITTIRTHHVSEGSTGLWDIPIIMTITPICTGTTMILFIGEPVFT